MKAGKKIPPKKILLNSILCMESQQKWQNNNAFERKERMNETNIFIRMDSAFRLLFDDEQYLFTIINRRVFWNQFFSIFNFSFHFIYYHHKFYQF